MTQAVIAVQSSDAPSEMVRLQAQAADLRVKSGDLEVQRDLIRRQREEAKPADRAFFDKQFADVQHQLNVVGGELAVVNAKTAELQHTRDMQAHEAQVLTVPPSPPGPFDAAQLREMVGVGGFVLLIPIVLALVRRIWVRGGPRAGSFDLDSTSRLQRMEQAIESIAIEVERIGESQRFTAKVLTEREAVAGRIPSPPSARREPGTITPH